MALSQSRITAAAKLAQATLLSEILGDTLTAWETGRLDTAKVRAICDATLHLDPVKARAVQARVLPRADTQSLFKAALKRAVWAVDPDGGDQRHPCQPQTLAGTSSSTPPPHDHRLGTRDRLTHA